MSRLRAVLVLTAAFLTLVGCAPGPGLAKTVSPRRTVPAGAENMADPTRTSGAPGKPVDPAFSVEKMRLMDPCRAMSKDLLQQQGTPDARYSGGTYTRCSNYMKDKAGKDLNFSIEIGYTMGFELKKADKQLAGLKSFEQKLDSDACFVSVVTQENPALGIRMQVGYKAGDPCKPGRELLEAIVKKLKSGPAKYTPPKGSPVELDPCVVPTDAMVKEAVGDGARSLAYGLHQCAWNSREKQVALDFRLTYVPKDNKFDDKQTVIDLPGGVKGYQVVTENAYPTCTIMVLLTKDGNNNGEIVEFEAGGAKEAKFDRCATSLTFAKAVLPKLPKA